MWLFMAAACFILQATDSQESLSRRHLNPETFMTISEIIQYWGYPSEEYQVLTLDGYYLQVNRIPYGVLSPGKTDSGANFGVCILLWDSAKGLMVRRKGLKEATLYRGPRPVVLVVHGFLYEGRDWIANVPTNSLGFFLADAGYDVWLINCRGTTWSRRHETLSIDQEEFWNFSWHEMGIYDVPAAIYFILEKTQQDELYYIGHSQGATIGLIAFSVMPRLGQNVKLFMAFAPPYTLVDLTGKFLPLVIAPEGVIRFIFGKKEFCLLSNKLKAMFARLCSYAVVDKICLQTTDVYRKENLNTSRADVYIGIYPDFSSVKTVIHWNQVWKSHQFKYFDYGSMNKAVYNMSTPPFYKIEDMIVPTAVWSGGKDRTATTNDIKRLLPRIKHLIFYEEIPHWDHQDFIWGLDAPELQYPDVLNLMEKCK